MDSSSHRALLEAAQAGDRAALDALVRLYYERVYRYGLRVCRDPADAQDAVQDAFVAMSRSVSSIRGEASLASWLFTVVKNACFRLLRPFIRAREPMGAMDGPEEQPLAGTPHTPEELLAREQLVQAVQHAIGALEPLHRQVIVLRDIEGLSGPEAAQALGLSLEAMKTRLHRARQALREHVRKKV
jgi:RNA polymerase sigma-70 factor (ECF subfamily)